MSVLIALFILIVIWGIVSIIDEKKMDEVQRQKVKNRIEKQKMISQLEKEIKKIKGE